MKWDLISKKHTHKRWQSHTKGYHRILVSIEHQFLYITMIHIKDNG